MTAEYKLLELTLVDVLDMKEMSMLIFAAVFGQSPHSLCSGGRKLVPHRISS
ncbi:uncharacterized protein STEHIDRAFT_118663 [Stereum hirsutum FP-91666 SS1]|uniref:uncharacterized protein n=1 Tax=Stereum hirsutum (strain FP-91666) TaxID=721885 RepID=UPI000440F405|nr:uncharacterized protein STEHIDRAFT_118663 [Stereum hirsutum FP-91666 SS1]EIM91682.1 hypothetical protein STEHIDRAFT_118663 [Stereum hirsutum FP-91666 SS1]